MGTFKTFAMYAGAVICLGGLIFAGIRMMSGRFQDAIPGLFGALFGAGVLGWGAGWIGDTGRNALAWIYLQSTEAITNAAHIHGFPLDRLDPTCSQCM